tara:strand:- start:2962 stop:5544 length:2583 start_codon:yes stop_codon:yes gene_type:complete
MNYESKEACLVRQYFSCNLCGVGRYHHKYAGIKSWQLAGDGRQICVQCPKWTRYEDKWRGDTSYNPCNEECGERGADPPYCKNRVVGMDSTCVTCDAGYTKFAVPMSQVSTSHHSGLVSKRSEGFFGLLATNEYILPGFDITGFQYVDLLAENRKDFQYMNVCKRCPSGMIGITDNAGVLGQTDFENENEELRLYVEEHKCHFFCTTCSKLDGVPAVGRFVATQCQQCKITNQFQLHQKQTLLVSSFGRLPRLDFVYHKNIEAVLPVGCESCPPGYELASYSECATNEQFSTAKKHACCKPCGLNMYKTVDDAKCIPKPDNHITTALLGASSVRICDLTKEKMVFCPPYYENSGYQQSCLERNTPLANFRGGAALWATCVPRNHLEFCEDDYCIACKTHTKGAANGALGEIYNFNTQTCELCDSCKYLTYTLTAPSIPIHSAKINEWNLYREPKLDSNPVQYLTYEVECTPLQRRSLQVNVAGDLEVIGKDEYKQLDPIDPYKIYTNLPIPSKHAAVNQSSVCGIVPCSDVCKSYYQFSDGCGPTYQNRAYVHHADTGSMLLDSVNVQFDNIDVDTWTLQTEGVCSMCKTCGNNEYNPFCNNYELVPQTGEIPGEGRCDYCRTDCEGFSALPKEAYYLYHANNKDGDIRGCDPANDSPFRLNENQIKVTTNYECAQCAVSMWTEAGAVNTGKRAQIWIVAGCGENLNYWYHTTQNGVYVPDEKQSTIGADAKYIGQHELLPYCPERQYYNKNKAGCQLEGRYIQDPYAAGRFIELSIGNILQPQYRLDCCEPCTECFLPQKPNMQYYQQCDGSSMEDTQNECIDKCPYGFYERNDTCVLCGSCACGESPDSFVTDECPSV